MDRKLINYLPDVVREYDVFKAMMAGEQPEFETAWDSVNNVLDNQFVSTAGDLGLSRWEKILGITPKGTESLGERRFRILTRLNEELPYTLPQLRNILETLCGEGNSSAEIEEGTYTLVVRVALVAQSNFSDVESLLERVVPENLTIDLSLLYSRYSQFEAFTHEELAAYTHDQLRKDAFE